jgi:predicted amidohydrolase
MNKNGSRVSLLCIIVSMALTTIAPAVAADQHVSPRGGGSVRVAGIVLKWITGDREANYQRAEALIREAAGNGAKIVCTPESFLDGYAIRDSSLTVEQLRAMAEPIPSGAYFRRLQKLVDELDIYFIAAITELDADMVYNSAALVGPDGQLIGTYRKKFLWVDERGKYSPGDAFPAFETSYGKIGMMICSDRRQQAAIRELVGNGAEIVFCPGGGGYGTKNDRIVSQRSLEGGVPIVFVHPIEFLVTGPDGSILVTELHGSRLDDEDRSDPGVVRYYDVQLND